MYGKKLLLLNCEYNKRSMFPSLGSVMWNMNQLNPWLNTSGILDLVIMKCCYTLAIPRHCPCHINCTLATPHNSNQQNSEESDEETFVYWKEFRYGACQKTLYQILNWQKFSVSCHLGKKFFRTSEMTSFAPQEQELFLTKMYRDVLLFRMDVMKIYWR